MKILNLNDTEMLATYVSVNQPDNDRKVLVHDYSLNHGVVVAGMCYRDGRWYGATTGYDLTDGLTDRAIWSEMLLQD